MTGASQINFTGIGGRAAALTVTYYPGPSITAAVVASTFLISMATDVGGYLRLEFIRRSTGFRPCGNAHQVAVVGAASRGSGAGGKPDGRDGRRNALRPLWGSTWGASPRSNEAQH
jgi:hypothetical protein